MTAPLSSLVFAIATAFAIAPLHATSFADDFARADVDGTALGEDIGPGWKIGTGTWALSGERLRVHTHFEEMKDNAVLWNTEVELRKGNFTTSLTRFRVTNPRVAGLAFMVQGADAFHAFRFGGPDGESALWELVQVAGDAVTPLESGEASEPWDSRVPYEVTITSTAPDVYHFKVLNQESSATVVDTTVTQPGLPDSGFAGPYYQQSSGQYLFDDFSAESPVATR